MDDRFSLVLKRYKFGIIGRYILNLDVGVLVVSDDGRGRSKSKMLVKD